MFPSTLPTKTFVKERYMYSTLWNIVSSFFGFAIFTAAVVAPTFLSAKGAMSLEKEPFWTVVSASMVIIISFLEALSPAFRAFDFPI